MHLSNVTNATLAVRVSQGCKSYGKSVVLHGLEMTVERGVTYALLGSSGCGKTTLLSSIVGIKKLSSGSVQIFGKTPSKNDRASIGFMPQESGLHTELTISEELHFFGRLYGMEWSFVEERICFLVDLLQLPGENCLIQNLSGGQTRRVSLAVTLLHKPRLLILDEATVGVDPLLRQSIWEHLYELVKQDRTTIICSTHYTEEARQADIVSVMRNGKLLVEENPDKLMTQFGATLLEDVVLKLCHSQELEQCPIKNDINSWDNNNTHDLDGNIQNISYKRRSSRDHWVDVTSARKYSNYSVNHMGKPLKKAECHTRHLQTIYAMLILHVIKFTRFPLYTIFLLTIPAVICIITWAVYSPEPHPKIGVVNLEQPNCLNLPPDQRKLGCELEFFLIQDDKLELETFQTEESALSAIHRGKNMAYFVIPRNFSTNTAQRFAFGRYADNATLTGSNIPVYMDFSHYVNNLFFLNGLWSGYKAFTAEKLAVSVNDTGEGGGIVGTPLSPFKFNEKMDKLSPVETTWYDKASMAVVACFIMVMPLLIALSIVGDVKRGVFQRTIIGGGSLPHVLISAVLAYGLIYLGQIGFIIGTIKCLQIPFQGSIIDVVILNYGQHLIGLTMGVFIGLILHEELEAIFFILGFFMLAFATGGGITTLESLGVWVKLVVIALPSKLASVAFENILFRGWTILNPGMLSCFINQGAWIASSLFLSILAYFKDYT